METPAIRLPQSYTCLGQEKHQMLDLNRRLESYLGRVKFLEEENQLLHEEIQRLRRLQEPQGQRRALEVALREAREELDRAWREKDKVELEMGNLGEELQAVGQQRQRVAAARAEAQDRLTESKKVLEEERRAQIWLKDKAVHLENELIFQEQVHQEDVSALKASLGQARPVQMAPANTLHTQSVRDLGLEYSQKAAEAWREATEAYQRQTERLEESLGQAKVRMNQISQERKENQLKLQSLAKDQEAARAKKEMLERRVGQQRDKHSQEISQLQAYMEDLEEEKTRLGGQIDDLIKESRMLLQLKMSLGLEVATYRTLLDGETQRVNDTSKNKHTIQTVSSTDGFLSIQELKQTLHKTHPSSHTNRPSTTVIRSSFQPKSLLTSNTPLPVPNHISPAVSEYSQAVQKEQVSGPEDWSSSYAAESLNGKDSVDQFRPEEVFEEITYAAALSTASTTSNTVPTVESFKKDTVEDKTETECQEVASETLVKEDSIMCDETVHSAEAVYDSAQKVDVHNTSAESELSAIEMGDPEGEKTDDFSEWIQPQHVHEPQLTWAKKDPATDVERIERVQEQPDISASESVTGITAVSELDVKKDMTNLPTEALDHVESISNGLADLEEKNAFLDSERETDMSQAQSAESMDDESNQINALESKAQETETICQGGHDKDFSEQEEVTQEEKVQDELRVFDDKDDIMFTGSEIVEGIMDKECVDTEQCLLTERDLEENVVSIPHHSFSMNLEVDPLPVHDDQEQTGDSKQHSDVHEDGLNDREEMDEEKDYSEGEEKDVEELDDSPNVSMSWRTDPGELDSYALDNTLADTRPLIRYKSDDTDVNTQASHMGVSDSSDSEDDREAGAGHRAVTKSKRFDTMEDLSEEPEVEALGERGLGETPHSMARDAHSENHYSALQEEYGDAESESMTVDTVSKLDEERTEMAEDHSRTEDKEADKELQDSEETWEDKEKLEDRDLMYDEQTEDSQENILHEDFPEETVETVVDMPPQTEQLFNEEVATETVSQQGTTEDLPKPEDLTRESSAFVQPLALAESILSTSHEAAEFEIKPSEESFTERGTIHASMDEKDEGDLQNLSMLTHVDLTENFSLISEPTSRPESQPQAASSDHNDEDESHSSDEESPNASQCSSPTAFPKSPKAHPALEEASENLSVTPLETLGDIPLGAFQGLSERFTEQGDYHDDEWEVLNTSSKDQGTGDPKNAPETFNPLEENFGNFSSEDYAKQTSEHVDSFQDDKIDKPLKSNGKDDGLHNFFSTNMEDNFWGSSQQMAATFNPDEINQEQYQSVTFQTNQNLRFEETWGSPEDHEGADGSAEKSTHLSKMPLFRMEEEGHSQEKTLLGREGEQVAATQSDDSIDEGDSWSSGEE